MHKSKKYYLNKQKSMQMYLNLNEIRNIYQFKKNEPINNVKTINVIKTHESKAAHHWLHITLLHYHCL